MILRSIGSPFAFILNYDFPRYFSITRWLKRHMVAGVAWAADADGGRQLVMAGVVNTNRIGAPQSRGVSGPAHTSRSCAPGALDVGEHSKPGATQRSDVDQVVHPLSVSFLDANERNRLGAPRPARGFIPVIANALRVGSSAFVDASPSCC